MFNPERIETIRGKIQISTILTPNEKSDWLNLLELMNDKQLSELEEILAAEQVDPNAAPGGSGLGSVTQSLIPNMPPLSHIANIPTDVEINGSSTNPAAAKAAVENRRPVPRTAPNIPSKPRKPFVLSKPEELQNLTLQSIRDFDLQTIFDAVRDSVTKKGYYHILGLVESSPLYESYIQSGKVLLGAEDPKITATIKDEDILSQAELEFVTDMLRHMRFNPN